jgi:hypothetical protein
VLAPAAAAQSYDLVSADVRVDVLDNGAVAVEEDIQVAFSGSFTYGYREIPYRSGERVQVLGVRERGTDYGPGASTELEPGGPPGTFGVDDLGGRVRIVWRFRAANEARTFTIRYRMTGLAVAYDDIVDVNLKVWGDEWEQRLGQLTAVMSGPGRVLRAWGHPVWVRGDVTLAGERASPRPGCAAAAVRRATCLYPRAAFTSTAACASPRERLEKIVAEERRTPRASRATRNGSTS